MPEDKKKTALLCSISKNISLFIGLATTLAYFLYVTNFLKSIENERNQYEKELKMALELAIKSSLNDINLLSRLEEVESALQLLLDHQPRYSQGRILDQNGREVFRLNVKKDGTTAKTETSELQDKSHRNYFNHLLELNDDQIYISPIDYNMENYNLKLGNLTFRVGKRLKNKYYPNHFVILNLSSSYLNNLITKDSSLKVSFDQSPLDSVFVSLLRGQLISQITLEPADFKHKKLIAPQWGFQLKKSLKDSRKLFVTTTLFYFFLSLFLFLIIAWTHFLREKQKELVQIFEKLINHHFSLRLMNPKGKTYYANQTFYKMFDLTNKENLQSFVDSLMISYTPISGEVDPKVNLLKGENWQGRVHYLTPSGKSVWFHSIQAPILSENHKIIGYGILETDISSLIEIEKNLKKQERQLLQANVMANIGSMSSVLSHQYSAPISILSSLNQSIEREFSKESPNRDLIEKKFQQIRSTIEDFKELTSYIKKLARVSQSDDQIDNQKANLTDVLQYSLRMTKNEIDQNHVSISADLGVHQNKQVNGSVILLSQIFINLIKNSIEAIESNQEKWIKIESITTPNQSEDSDPIILHFTDSGNGIPASEHEKIFESYYSTKDLNTGSGLGLSIVRQILNRYQGTIEIAADAPHTTFVITFKKA